MSTSLCARRTSSIFLQDGKIPSLHPSFFAREETSLLRLRCTTIAILRLDKRCYRASGVPAIAAMRHPLVAFRRPVFFSNADVSPRRLRRRGKRRSFLRRRSEKRPTFPLSPKKKEEKEKTFARDGFKSRPSSIHSSTIIVTTFLSLPSPPPPPAGFSYKLENYEKFSAHLSPPSLYATSYDPTDWYNRRYKCSDTTR